MKAGKGEDFRLNLQEEVLRIESYSNEQPKRGNKKLPVVS